MLVLMMGIHVAQASVAYLAFGRPASDVESRPLTVPSGRPGEALWGGGQLAASESALRAESDSGHFRSRAKPNTASTSRDTDDAFGNGSGITIHKLDHTQIQNLVTLGKVWGFLKYYDPAITSGKQQWDYALLRVLPKILAARSRTSANGVIVRWINGLGPVAHRRRYTSLDNQALQLRPDVGWIANTHRLGKALSKKLQWIRKQRRPGPQFYVTLTPEVGNPIFKHEPSYRDIHFPDAGFQLLALYRFWNIIEYWYPNRNVIGEDWNKVLATFIPRLALAGDRTAYQLQMT